MIAFLAACTLIISLFGGYVDFNPIPQRENVW
jgi:hypothetical protein